VFSRLRGLGECPDETPFVKELPATYLAESPLNFPAGGEDDPESPHVIAANPSRDELERVKPPG
jgi:hypothetical protein